LVQPGVVRPAAGGDRGEGRPGQEDGEQSGHDAGLEPVRAAPQRVAVQPQLTGKPCPPRHRRRLVFHHMSRPDGCRSAALSGNGRVPDLAELGAQLVWAGSLLVVGDADAPGADVYGDLLDAWV